MATEAHAWSDSCHPNAAKSCCEWLLIPQEQAYAHRRPRRRRYSSGLTRARRPTVRPKSEPIRILGALRVVETNLGVLTRPEAHSLLDAARRGDGDAFARLVEPALAPALAVATVVTGSKADGADAVQEALVGAWRGLSSLRDADAFSAWFGRLAVRAAIKVASRQRRHRLAEIGLDRVGEGVNSSDSGSMDRALRLRTLDRAFDRLDPKDRSILALRHIGGFSTSEIASALSIPEGTVKSRVHASMRRLRAAYEAEERR